MNRASARLAESHGSREPLLGIGTHPIFQQKGSILAKSTPHDFNGGACPNHVVVLWVRYVDIGNLHTLPPPAALTELVHHLQSQGVGAVFKL